MNILKLLSSLLFLASLQAFAGHLTHEDMDTMDFKCSKIEEKIEEINQALTEEFQLEADCIVISEKTWLGKKVQTKTLLKYKNREDNGICIANSIENLKETITVYPEERIQVTPITYLLGYPKNTIQDVFDNNGILISIPYTESEGYLLRGLIFPDCR